MPDFNFVINASNLVCVSIGANFLLPVAPSIMSHFFQGIQIDPESIVDRHFKDVKSCIDDNDLERLGSLASAVKRRNECCMKNPGLFWKIIDVLFALFGIFLLWSGWTNEPKIAVWMPVLFVPLVLAAGYPFVCYLYVLARLKISISRARRHAKKKMKELMRQQTKQQDTYLKDFVEKAKSALDN